VKPYSRVLKQPSGCKLKNPTGDSKRLWPHNSRNYESVRGPIGYDPKAFSVDSLAF
jgi:hypothetical protein